MKIFGSLSGIKVLDLSRLLPGPYCSMILADHGARVTSIEDRRFKADDMFIKPLYRNKEHMTLNLKSDEGKNILYRLVKDADVFLEGFRPGVVQKLGVDFDTLRQINPKLIYCSITGYGQTGPLKSEPGHDINYLSRAGILDLIGESKGRPVIPGIQVADVAGGSMNAVIGILMALYAREKTGQGQYIDISMTDGVLGFMTLADIYNARVGHLPGRGNWLLSHRYACYNTYETADGRYLSIGALEPRFWKKLCDHLNIPEYIPLQFDNTRRQSLIDHMADIFKQKSLDEWDDELSGLDICYSRIQNFEEVRKDPLFTERDMIIQTAEEDEQTTVIGVPVKLSRTPGSVRTKAVDFGENTPAVLRRMGYSDEQIKELESKNAI